MPKNLHIQLFLSENRYQEILECRNYLSMQVSTLQKAKSATFLNKIPIGIREELWYEISYADKKCQQKAYGIRVCYRILEEF